MLQALLEDVSAFAETVTILDDRLSVQTSNCIAASFDLRNLLWSQWVEAAKDCDAAIIIAPERDGNLAMGVAMLRSAGIDVVAGSGDFLRTSSDKLLTAQALHRARVAHPLFMASSDKRMADQIATFDRFVVKPRDGCGTLSIVTYESFDEASNALCENSILQPWMPGQSISISLVATGSDQFFLPAVSQTISDGDCQYVGGCGPLENEEQRRATSLASRAIAAMPPTARGFVGIDMILGETSSDDYVIEINPRLATSYIGLRKMIQGNLAARFFELESGPVSCKVAAGAVRWTTDGSIEID